MARGGETQAVRTQGENKEGKGKSISEMKIKLEGSQGKIDTGKCSVEHRQ